MATKSIKSAFTDALHSTLNFFGLGDLFDGALWALSKRVGGPDRDSYLNNLITKINNEINKLRKINSSKLNRANALLTDLAQSVPSSAFKDKINDLKRSAIKTIDLASDIDNKINATEDMARNQASKLANQTFIATADLLPQVNKEVDMTIQSLKNNIGEKENATETRF